MTGSQTPRPPIKVNHRDLGHSRNAQDAADTINALADEGRIKPIVIVFSDGRRTPRFNSMTAATNFLKVQGFYKPLDMSPKSVSRKGKRPKTNVGLTWTFEEQES